MKLKERSSLYFVGYATKRLQIMESKREENNNGQRCEKIIIK